MQSCLTGAWGVPSTDRGCVSGPGHHSHQSQKANTLLGQNTTSHLLIFNDGLALLLVIVKPSSLKSKLLEGANTVLFTSPVEDYIKSFHGY